MKIFGPAKVQALLDHTTHGKPIDIFTTEFTLGIGSLWKHIWVKATKQSLRTKAGLASDLLCCFD